MTASWEELLASRYGAYYEVLRMVMRTTPCG